MITKQQLLDSMKHETEVIKHLATKVPQDQYDYRPTEQQRSTGELMQYMTQMAIVPAKHAITASWDHAEEYAKRAEESTPATFDADMDRQMNEIAGVFAEIDESEATTKPAAMPWGTPTTVAAGLMDMALKCFVAYRMQFFLHIKASGVSDIGPANCWAGMDQPPTEEAEATENN